MTSSQPTIAEQYACALDCKEPNNYTQLPNIIDHLTYDDIDSETGITTVKRLSVYAIQLYRVLRTIAGQENMCWKTAENLAELSNMSEGQISKCKKELLQNFHQLDGNPLITIESKEKTPTRDGKKTNGTIYHLIRVVNIWHWNRAFFLLKKWEKEQASSPQKPAESASSPQKPAPKEASSLSEATNITYNNIPLSKEQHSTAKADSVCFLDTEEQNVSVSPNQEISMNVKTQAFNWFMQIGCDLKSATFFVENYSTEDIEYASKYVKQQIAKKKQKNQHIPNIIGYLRRTLEEKWWIPQKK